MGWHVVKVPAGFTSNELTVDFVYGSGVLFLGELYVIECDNFMDNASCPIELCELDWMKDDYYPEFPRKNFMNLIVGAINSNPLFNNNKDLIRKLFSNIKGELWTFML